MKIDVIIPTYRPGKALFALIDDLEAQTCPPERIILVNTEEKYFHELVYGTKFELQHKNVKVYHISRREFDHGGTRHQAVQRSDAEAFVCMTQDARPADVYLLEKLAARLSEDVAVSYARQLPGPGSSEYERIARLFNYPEKSCVKSAADLESMGIKTFFCSNVCAAYRRDIYDELGGFIRHTIFNEDMIYAAAAVRAGYKIVYEAGAKVIHSHNYTNIQQLRRNFDLGVSQADNPGVFDGVSSESEGAKLAAAAWNYLKGRKRLYKFPGFCVQCCFKYMGYLLGRHYMWLPKGLVLKITANRIYWES